MYTDTARSFVASARVGRFATVDPDGRPHVVPICYALVGDVVVSAIDEKPKRTTRLQRVRNVEATPHVSLVVDHYSEDWADLAWVQVRGRASARGPDDEIHGRAVTALREKYEQYEAHALESRPILEMRPNRVLSWGLD